MVLGDCKSPGFNRSNIFSITGQLVKKEVEAREATTSLPRGIYIIGNRKVTVP